MCDMLRRPFLKAGVTPFSCGNLKDRTGLLFVLPVPPSGELFNLVVAAIWLWISVLFWSRRFYNCRLLLLELSRGQRLPLSSDAALDVLRKSDFLHREAGVVIVSSLTTLG